jgi:hypothetical protein
MQLKLEREDASIALTVKAATTAKIVNPMRSMRLQPPYMDKRTSGRRKRPWGELAAKNEVRGRKIGRRQHSALFKVPRRHGVGGPVQGRPRGESREGALSEARPSHGTAGLSGAGAW